MTRARRLVGAVVALVLAGVLTPVAHAQSPEGTSTAAISVDPASDLVDGQTVTVTGSGWGEYYVAIFYECSADLERCAGPFGYAVGDDHGDFEDEIVVRAAFVDEDGPVDCRTEDCVVVAGVGIESGPREADPAEADSDLIVPVTFDPSAPLLDPPSLAAEPATDLIDDQQVVLTGERFVPEEAVVYQCPAGFTDPRDECRFDDLADFQPDGTLSERERVRTVLHNEAGDVDCRTTDCVFAVVGSDGRTIASVALAFDPDAPLKPPPVLTVTPSTGLVDGQAVVVEGEHFSSNWHGIILECPVDREDDFDCSLDYDLVRFPTADADGHFRITFEVAAEIRSNGETLDCRVDACALWSAFEYDDYNTASASISFAAAPGPPATPTAVTPAFTG